MTKKIQFLCVFYLLSAFACNYGSNNTESPAALNKALIQAVKSENPDLETIKSLLTKEADINSVDEHDYSVLNWAVIYGSEKLVELLLSQGAHAERKNQFGHSPLQYAAFLGNEVIVEMLLKHGAKANEALAAAIAGNKEKVIDLLLHKDYNKFVKFSEEANNAYNCIGNTSIQNKLKGMIFRIPNPYPLSSCNILIRSLAAFDDSVFITHLKEINQLDPNQPCVNAVTAIMLASIWKRNTALKTLIKLGAQLDTQDTDGYTALHLAATNNNSEAIELLCDAGANKEIVNKDNKTPLQFANDKPAKKAALIMLLEKGAQWLPSKDANDMLNRAMELHSNEMAAISIERGVNPKAIDNNGQTWLHKIATYNPHYNTTTRKGSIEDYKPEFIKPFLDKGVDINALDKDQKVTALYYAVLNSKSSLVKALIDSGANPNLPDEEGNTPLHIAIGTPSSNDDIPNLLVTARTNINAKNKKNHTPFEYALLETKVISDSLALFVRKGVKIPSDNFELQESLYGKLTMKNTLLHLAAFHGLFKLSQALVDLYPAMKDEKNSEGRKPIDVFEKREQEVGIEMFKDEKPKLKALLKTNN